jgi:hypothetical protein
MVAVGAIYIFANFTQLYAFKGLLKSDVFWSKINYFNIAFSVFTFIHPLVVIFTGSILAMNIAGLIACITVILKSIGTKASISIDVIYLIWVILLLVGV